MLVVLVTVYRMTCFLKRSDVIWRSWSAYSLLCKTGVFPCQIRILDVHRHTARCGCFFVFSTLVVPPQIRWTITSGMWNTLRTLWGLNMETLLRIHESCKSQSHLEYVDIFTPTRHILQTIRRTWKICVC